MTYANNLPFFLHISQKSSTFAATKFRINHDRTGIKQSMKIAQNETKIIFLLHILNNCSNFAAQNVRN